MIRRLLFFLLLLNIKTVAHSQVYHALPDSGAVWTVLSEAQNVIVPYQYGYDTYSLSGDTLIGNTVYRRFRNSTGYDHGGLREDTLNNRIYFAGVIFGQSFPDSLLYDFNVQIGDTACMDPTGEYYVVNTIDSVLILGQFRKRIQMTSQFGLTDEWIEGVGSTNHPFRPAIGMEFEGNWTTMCLQNDTTGIYNHYNVVSNNGPWYPSLHPGYCGLTTIGQIQANAEVSAFIRNGFLFIKVSAFDSNCTYQIIDISGREIILIKGSDSAEIDLNQFPPGMYLLQIYDQSSNFHSQKLLIQ